MTELDQECQPEGVVIALARDDVARKKFLQKAGRSIGGAAAAGALGTFIAACGSSSQSQSSAAVTATQSSTAATSTPASTATSTSATATSSSTTAAATSASGIPASFGMGDAGIVNYALTLEYLESAFYADVIKSGLFSGHTLSVLKDFGSDEDQHVQALHAVAVKLGTPAAQPKAKFPLSSAAAVTQLAAKVEDTGASAYLGQAPYIQSAEILAAALAIHTIESRHAATLNLLLKRDPTHDAAFAKPATPAAVLAAVKPFIVG